MVRQGLWSCLAILTVLVFVSSPAVAADAPDITGKYSCEGTNAGGATYKGTCEISKKGDTYLLKWALDAGDSYVGIGLLEGKVLAVAFNGGVVVYRIEKDGKLVGRWAVADGKGSVQTENLTK